ncbi:uncharacterized protein LOC124116970 isoform X2 [Haliotis rufescens]|uniref:uncharacterized protein LOC124116970 isoform X2 n=1 Tax=Haliotis rufescens TaxID=6454 RepID=UPI001EAFE5E3|nr:uncharacterized protein LOC124116970 isoform X2 [Haliotis rufescens]
MLQERLGAGTPVKYMINSCKSRVPIYVNSSLILELTREFADDRSLIGFRHCAVDVETTPSQRLFLHYEAISISAEAGTKDRLHIYDYNDDGKRVRVTPPNGIYGVLEHPYYNTARVPVRDYKSSSNKIRVDYFGKPTVMYQGFRLLLTVYRPTQRHGGCGGGLLTCVTERICISPRLHCDGLANCGSLDGSDEHHCRGRAQATTDLLESYSVVHAVAAAIVSCAVFLLVATAAMCWVKTHNHKLEYKPKSCVRWTSNGTVRTSMTRLYAPPSYESVVVDTEDNLGPPPDYSVVAASGPHIREDNHKSPNDLKPSYSSVEVAILHEQPRELSMELNTTEDHAPSLSTDSSDTDPDSGSKETWEATSDYVSRNSSPYADSLRKHAGSISEKGIGTLVTL